MTESPFVDTGFAVLVFSPGDDPIACLNKAMAFLTAVASSRFPSTNNQLRTSSNPRNQATIQDGRVIVQQVQGRQWQNYSSTTYKSNATSSRGNTTSGQARVVKCYNYQGEGYMARQCTHPKRPRNAAWYKEKAVLAEAQEAGQILDEEQLAFLADPGIPAGIANFRNYRNDIDKSNVGCIRKDFEQSPANKEQNNETITAELERYKERVKTFEQRLNIDLSSREKMIDSQMDDMIREKLALKEQVDSLEQNLSKQIKEKESVLQTFAVFKNESKEKENKYIENEIDLEKKIKELDNIIFKVRIKLTLYDGVVMSNTHVAMPVIDDEETLILEEESRSKMSIKAKDPEVIAKKISHKPIDYEKLNRLTEDFGKRFTPQQELSAEQAFWFHILNPTIEPSYTPPVIVDVPSELPKVSLVNASLKKLKFHLTQFDTIVKKRTTPNALEEGKEIVKHVVRTPSATTIAPSIFKLDLVLLPPRLLQNRDAHIDYLRHTQEQANTLREIVKQAKAKQPLDSELDFACKYATRIKELLVYVQDTCPNAITPSTKKVAVSPMNNIKKVRFAEPLTSSSNIKQVESSNTSDSNTPMLSSTGVKCSTSNCGSKPPGNKRNDRISQTPSRNQKNKVEAQPRKVNKMNRVVKPICDVDVMHSLSNTNSEILCATCNKSMFDGVHDKCLLNLVQNGNNHTKSVKKHKKQNIWKPTGHVFTQVGFKWKPTGRTFTIVGNSCPLTSITSTNVVSSKQTTSHSAEIQKPDIKVYSRKPKNVKNIGSSKIAKIVESKNASHSKPIQTWGSNATDIPSPSSLVMTGCPNCTLIARIMGYGDYQLRNVVISRVYYVEGLVHNLFSVGQFCDADLEVAFRKNTCFIRNLEGVDLLSGSRDTNLYTISLDDMLKSSSICLLSKASKTKSWLWHRRLSHLNFGTLNMLAKDDLARGIPRLKFQKDRFCSAYNGTEFVNQILREFYENVGISHQTSVAHTPQQKVLSKGEIGLLDDWDRLFQPMFDEYFNPPTITVSPVQEAAAPRAEVLADSPVWTKDHPIAKVIGDPSRSVSTWKQLETDVMWCYFDAFLTLVEPKNFKQAMTEPSWINAMQEEIHKFKRLKV
ncbi:retrovirus-related pol polyprotein from transposon TNT 1-94 [Tanacetum coccineum]